METTEGLLDARVILSPRWLRVPSAVTYSGLSKSYLYPAIIDGRIRSACLRAHGDASRGIRLIDRLSLDDFIAAHAKDDKVEATRGRDKLALQTEVLSNAERRPHARLESKAKCGATQANPEKLRVGVRTPLDD
jgi:hypothetical protein